MSQSASAYLGSVDGHFSVDADGGACYTIPIKVPPGTGGMEPHLALAYNSGAGNGFVGVGWSLHGLSSIMRCAATEAQDGFRGTIAYDDNDRFALDGQRLMVVSGDGYGATNAVYHTEVEGWQKVVPMSNGSQGSGPDSFVVYAKDGHVYEYGATPDSRVAASADNQSARVWALNKVTDLNGNSMTVTYEADAANNTNYPLSIDYTFNEGLTQYRTVKFVYDTRPDTCTRYTGGYPVTTTRLLKQIQTYLGSDLVRTYTLKYEQGQATGRSRLSSVTEADAEGSALPATTFEWQDGSTNIFDACADLPATNQLWQGTMLSLDANGDGLGDLVNASQAPDGNLQLTLFLANETGFANGIVIPTTIPYAQGMQILPMDVDGDGCIDLVCAQENGFNVGLTVLLSRPDGDSGWTFEQGTLNGGGPSDLPWGGQFISMDVDGDGLADLVYSYQNGNTLALAVLFSNGSAFAPSSTDETNPTADFFPGAQYLGGDFNGDGMSDLVYAYQSGEYMSAVLFLSAGRNGLIQQSASPLPSPDALPAYGALTALDINGDGLTDIVQTYLNGGSLVVNALPFNGVSFETPVAQTFEIPNLGTATPTLLPMDVNGDGLPDLVITGQDGNNLQLSVLLSNGAGFSLQSTVTQPPSSIQPQAVILPLDSNGDGLTDIVYAYNAGDANQSLALSRMLAAGPFPDLLTLVTNGLGGKFEIAYAPLTDTKVYSKNASTTSGQVGVQNLLNNSVSGATYAITSSPSPTPTTPGSTPTTRLADFPKYVVVSHTKDDAIGQTYSYEYFYAAALLDLTGRGWLGFESMRVSDEDLQTVTLTQYNQQFPLTCSLKSSTVNRMNDGALMHRITHEYEQAENPPNTGPGVWTVATQSVRTDLFNFTPTSDDPTPDSTDLTTYVYGDGFGNATQTSYTGTNWGASLYIFETYLNDPAQWVIGLKTGHKSTSDAAGEEVLAQQLMAYDPTTFNLLNTQFWNDQTQDMETTTFEYDAYGNQTSATDSSGAVNRTAYDETYHAFIASKTSPTNAAGQSLTWRYAYYPQFGERQSETDCNGVVKGQTVDGLGRVSGTYGPNPSGETVTLSTLSWATDESGTYAQVDALADWTGTTGWARRYLDGFARVWRTATLGPDGRSTVLVDKTLNSRGMTLKQSLPYYEGDTPLYILHTYDNFGRQIQLEQPTGADSYAMTTIVYETVSRTVQTEAAGQTYARTTTSEYATFNSKRLLVSQTDAKGATTRYVYDALGRLVSVEDGAGVVTSIGYDSLNRKIAQKVLSASGTILSQERFTFDDAARTATHTDARGTKFVQTYDALRRLVSRTVQPQDGAAVETTYTLDGSGASYSQGRVSSVQLQGGAAYSYGYDANGNQSELTVTIDGEAYTFHKSYLPGGRVGQLTFPDLSVQTNNYNAGRQLTSVSVCGEGNADPQTLATYSNFYPFGAAGHVAYGNSTTADYVYDDGARLTSKSFAGTSGALLKLTYGWNDLFQLTGVEDLLTPVNTQSFEYDPVGRLAQATGSYPQQTYEYDDGGNITLKDGISYESDGYRVTTGMDGDRQVFTAAYDANGNTISAERDGATSTYLYDGDNQLVETGGLTTAYDYTGRRVTRSIAGGPTVYYVAPHYEVVVFPDGSRQHSRFIFAGEGLVASLTDVDSGTPPQSPGIPAPGTFYLHKDHILSSLLQTDASGNVVTRLAYRPYGEMDSLEGADTAQQKFTGKEWDDASGLYYFGARYYDPTIGRFITPDDRLGARLGSRDALNRYAYVINDPVNHFDPTGHSIFSGIGHFFSHSLPNFFTNNVKNFFTHSIPAFFANKVTKLVVSYVVDGLLIVGGVVATAVGGPLGAVIGATLLGAGISGIVYDTTALIKGGQVSWAGWGEQLGIGAATGLISGGIAVGAGAIADSLAAAGRTAFQVAQGGRIAVNIVAGIVGNAGANMVGTVFNNLATHASVTAGLGTAALAGALLGLLSSGITEGITSKLTRTPTFWDATDEQFDQMNERSWLLQNTDPTYMESSYRGIESPLPFAPVLDTTFRNTVALAAPGIGFSFFSGGLSVLSNKGWIPQWP